MIIVLILRSDLIRSKNLAQKEIVLFSVYIYSSFTTIHFLNTNISLILLKLLLSKDRKKMMRINMIGNILAAFDFQTEDKSVSLEILTPPVSVRSENMLIKFRSFIKLLLLDHLS